MYRLYQAVNLQEAHLLLHQLEQADIRVHLFNEYAQGALGDIPFSNAYPEIWLDDAHDLPQARHIVTRFEQRPEPQGTVRCTGCGEDNPDNFETCWQCGAPLHDA